MTPHRAAAEHLSSRGRSPAGSFLNHLTVRGKLLLLSLPGMFAVLLLAGWHASETYKQGYRSHEQATRDAVETATGVLAWAHAQELSGAMTREKAQHVALEAVAALRYGGKEYFWINDMHPTVLMHPIKPELNGKDASGIKDPDGKALFVAFADTVRQHGSGFVPYLWPKPGSDKPVPKLSYVKGFKPWGWVVGSGIYIDDLRTALMDQLMQIAVWVGILAVVLGVLAQRVSRVLIDDLRRVTELTRRISSGDLSQEIAAHSRDEIGQLILAMSEMTTTLRKLVREVQECSVAVEGCSVEISGDNGNLATRTQRQAAALEETAATMEQLTGTIRQNAERAHGARELASTASGIAAESSTTFKSLVQTMGGINDSSRKISDIVGVVHDIARQTNILALNAEVEAARAAEHGRGFAAVASEVRRLAERSADAVKEIRGLIGVSMDQVGKGSALVVTASNDLNGLVAAVQQLSALVAEISVATNEQSNGVSEAGQAIAEIDRVTQENATLVAETNEKAQTLEEQSLQLVRAMSVFRLGDGHDAERPQLRPRTEAKATAPRQSADQLTRRRAKQQARARPTGHGGR